MIVLLMKFLNYQKKIKSILIILKSIIHIFINKIINNQIENSLNHFTEINILNCIVYFSQSCMNYI